MANAVSIVFHGRFIEEDIEHIRNATMYSDNVILSTWSGSVSIKTEKYLNTIGCRVIMSDDPGSLKSYYHSGNIKQLNVNRQIVSFLAAVPYINHEIVLKQRPDLKINYSQLPLEINDTIYVLPETTINPKRKFGPDLYLHYCDWAHLSYLRNLTKLHTIDEKNFLIDNHYYLGAELRVSKLAAEQILSIMLCGIDPQMYSNKDLIILRKLDTKYANNFTIMHQIDYHLRKYKGVSIRYINRKYDDGYINFLRRLFFFIFYLRVVITSRIKNRRLNDSNNDN